MTGDATNEAAQDFLPQLLGVFRSGMIAVMIAVGNRTGLFDVMAPLPPSTSMEIAKAAGVSVREADIYLCWWCDCGCPGAVTDC